MVFFDFMIRRISVCRDCRLVHDIRSEALIVQRTVVRFPAVAFSLCWRVDFFLSACTQVAFLINVASGKTKSRRSSSILPTFQACELLPENMLYGRDPFGLLSLILSLGKEQNKKQNRH